MKTSRTTFSIFYYLNKSRANENGELPIYVRVTVNGTKSTISIKRLIHPKNWSQTGQPIGNSMVTSEIRNYMLAINSKLYDCHSYLCKENQLVTADMVRDVFNGASIRKSERLFFDVLEQFITKQQELIGADVSQLTVNRYKLLRNTFRDFLSVKNIVSDNFLLSDVSKDLLKDFEHYLKVKKNSGHNNAMKYLQRLKKFIYHCIEHKLLDDDPFVGVKINMKSAERGYLTQDELDILMTKDFGIKRLNVVRDMFVFSCFTGLAYIDSKNLTRSHIEKSPDGIYWIRTHRQKTNTRSNIPLLAIAMEIINRYVDLDTLAPSDKVLPLSSNVKTNAYLKEISIIAGIDKNLTTHLARHRKTHYSLSIN